MVNFLVFMAVSFKQIKFVQLFGAAACHLRNTSSCTITEVKQRWAWLVLGWETVQVLPECCFLPLKSTGFDKLSYTGCWLCVHPELAIGQCRLEVHGTCSLNNPWHRTCRRFQAGFGIPSRPPNVTDPCGQLDDAKKTSSKLGRKLTYTYSCSICISRLLLIWSLKNNCS